MAKFNPDVSQVQDGKYLDSSKGIEVARPNSAFEKLFEGVAGLGDGIVKAWDESNVNDIKQQTVAGVDQIRSEVGVDQATDKAAGGNTLIPNQNGSPVPGAITKAGDDVSRLRDAYNQGKINDSYYWGRVNALAKQIRTQYPGYRDQIDQTFSGVTGANPANALRKAIQSDFDASQSALQAASNKEDTYVNQKADIIGQVAPDYFQRKAAGNPYNFDEIRDRVMKRETLNQIRSQEASELDLESKKGTLTADRAQGSATAQMNDIVNQSVAAGVQSLGTKIQEALKSGKPLDPQQITEFQAAYGQLRAKAEVQMNQALNKPFGDDPTKTYASTIKDAAKLKGIKDNALSNLESMRDLLTNGQYGVFQMNASMAKAQTDYKQAQILQSSDAARKLQAAQQIAGPAINGLVLRHPQLLDDFSEAMNAKNISESVTGEGSITKQLGELKNPSSNKIGRGAASRLIDDKANSIISKEMPDTAKVNVAKSMFSDGESDFLTKFNSADQLKVFQRMTSPEVTKEMIRLKAVDPSTFENYRKWSVNSFSTLLKTQANSVADIAKYNSDVEIGFDPKTMQYAIKSDTKPISGVGDVVGALDTGPVALAKKISLGNAQQSLNQINASLANLKPILDGAGDPEALAKVLTSIDPKSPKEQGMIEWLGNGLLKAVNTLQPISSAKGATPKANPKADLQLAAYTPEETKDGLADSIFTDQADLGGVSLDEVQKSVASGKTGPLLDAISKGESGGSYNKIYGGREVPLTDMTIQEVMSLQNKMLNSGAPSTAVGKYQFISKTLKGAVAKLGLSADTQFTPEVQDKLAHVLLEGRGLSKYLNGSLSESAFLDNIASEWAAVKGSNGRGKYDGDGLNRVGGSTGVLEQIRALKS